MSIDRERELYFSATAFEESVIAGRRPLHCDDTVYPGSCRTSFLLCHAVTDIFEPREGEVVSIHPLSLQHDIVQRGVLALFFALKLEGRGLIEGGFSKLLVCLSMPTRIVSEPCPQPLLLVLPAKATRTMNSPRDNILSLPRRTFHLFSLSPLLFRRTCSGSGGVK